MPAAEVQYIDTAQGRAYVIDAAFDEATLNWISNDFRLSLPLDAKRPTVDRRFFADGPCHSTDLLSADSSLWLHPDRPVAHILEEAIQHSIGRKTRATSVTDAEEEEDTNQKSCHVFRYQRFLEYIKPGSKLDPHTDGTKICDDTQLTSTHTLLLYLTDCRKGGETLLMTECTKELPPNDIYEYDKEGKANDTVVLYATQPRRGRILLFPHATPHAGATVVDVPKICLRAEVCLRMGLHED